MSGRARRKAVKKYIRYLKNGSGFRMARASGRLFTLANRRLLEAYWRDISAGAYCWDTLFPKLTVTFEGNCEARPET